MPWSRFTCTGESSPRPSHTNAAQTWRAVRSVLLREHLEEYFLVSQLLPSALIFFPGLGIRKKQLSPQTFAAASNTPGRVCVRGYSLFPLPKIGQDDFKSDPRLHRCEQCHGHVHERRLPGRTPPRAVDGSSGAAWSKRACSLFSVPQ